MADEKTYKLKDQTTSFYDDATGLSVTRDEKVKINVSEGAGRKTLLMIKKGGLIEVKGPAAPPSGHDPNAGEGDGAADDSLDESFPGYKALKDANITTRTQVAAMTTEDLIAVKGIGPKIADEIAEALKPAAKK